MYEEHGRPDLVSDFWRAVSANSYLEDLSGSIQIHHGMADASVDWRISEIFHNQLEDLGIEHEYYLGLSNRNSW